VLAGPATGHHASNEPSSRASPRQHRDGHPSLVELVGTEATTLFSDLDEAANGDAIIELNPSSGDVYRSAGRGPRRRGRHSV
jgi:hypothetical protein